MYILRIGKNWFFNFAHVEEEKVERKLWLVEIKMDFFTTLSYSFAMILKGKLFKKAHLMHKSQGDEKATSASYLLLFLEPEQYARHYLNGWKRDRGLGNSQTEL